MNEIRINDPLNHHLAKKRPVHIIGGIHHDEHEALLKMQTPDFIVPPLNTHINFLKFTKSYSDQDHLDLHLKYSTSNNSVVDTPEIYDWRFVYPVDDSTRKSQKRNIMPPDNQYLCGSCWAISTASVIGDAFVVAGLVDWRPEISTAWALACYPQGKCDGGSPALLLQDIARGSGIPSKHCMDYSFCAKNEKCNGKAVQHFEAQNLSSLVPQECGCYYGGDVKHYNYLINKDVKTLAIGYGATTADNVISAIKKHILLHGPVLTGYFVMKNFSSGYFTKINGGVYLDRANYIPGSSLTFSDSEVSGQNYKGSHAVAIIGWGVAKNIFYDNDKRGEVPYWYCRNSWGPNWGADNGYFKMAMYPFNKVSQFGKVVDIVDGRGQRHRCGGIVTFTVSQPPQKKNFKTLSRKPSQLLREENYYKKSEEGYKPTGNPRPPNSGGISSLSDYFSLEDLLLYMVLPALIILAIIMVFKELKLKTIDV
jgi:hypothetical protein